MVKMPICPICGMSYTSPDGCPYCGYGGNGSEDQTYKPSDSSASGLVDVEMDLPPQNAESNSNALSSGTDPIPIEDDFNYEPRNYVICPSCGHKNPRLALRCEKCGSSLPVFDSNTEREVRDKKIIQMLDPNLREHYYFIGLQLFIAKLLGKEKKARCNSLLPNGQRCDYILTPFDKVCPKCGRKYAYYPCIHCGNLVAISDIRCPHCHTPTYLSDVIDVLEGAGSGEGAETILNNLENTFKVKLRKQAIPAFVNQSEILESKFRVESIARKLKGILDLLLDYLRDFMQPRKVKMDMPDAFHVISRNNAGVTQMYDVNAPEPSPDLQELIRSRERQIREAESQQLPNGPEEIPEVDNENVETFIIPDTDSNTEEESSDDDDDSPWGDIAI